MWIYPIFEAVQRAGGAPALTAFMALLASIVISMAHLGVWLVPTVQPQPLNLNLTLEL